jgi:hypothetical protein
MTKKFLIAFYFKKLNGKYDEFTEFKETLTNQDTQQATVILNLTDRVVVKNEFNLQADYKNLFDYYYPIHKDKIDRFITR